MKTLRSLTNISSLILIPMLVLTLSVQTVTGTEDGGQPVVTGERMANPYPPVVIRHDPNPNFNRVPPPDWFTDQGPVPPPLPGTVTINFLPAGSAKAKWGDITIPWPANARAAVLYAARIWASGLNTTVPITIDAGWVNNLGSGILGHSGAIWYYRNFSGAPVAGTWYPVALANTLNGSDLAVSDADIYMGFSSTFSWYTGRDGDPSGSQHDLVSVVLHEICHGLGFSGSMNGSGAQGKWGLDSAPTNPKIYDRFAEDNNGVKLINTGTYPNPSAALATALKSGNVYFDGFNSRAANGNARVPLYAPSSWNSGSSFSHLAQSFDNSVNALMTYSLSRGESEHSPGPVSMGILEDLGWSFAPVALLAPTGLAATDGTYIDKVRLTWNARADATHYKVYRTGRPGGLLQLIAGEVVGTVYDDTTAVPGTRYYYYIKAGSAWSTSTLSAYNGGNILGPPSVLIAQKGFSSNSILVVWNVSPGATKYAVYRNVVNNPATSRAMTGNATVTSYEDSGLPMATAYYYWIKSGNNNGWSDYSASELGFTKFELAIAQGDWTYKDGKKNDKLKGKNVGPVLKPYLKSGYEIGIRDPVTDMIINGPHTLTTKNEKVWFYKEKKAVIVKYKEVYNEKKDRYKTQVKYTVWGDIPLTNTVFVRKPGEPDTVVNEVEFNLVPAGKVDEDGWQTLLVE